MKRIVISINSLLNNRGSEALIRGLVEIIKGSTSEETDITVISKEKSIVNKERIEYVDRYVWRYHDVKTLAVYSKILRGLKILGLYKYNDRPFSHLQEYVACADTIIVVGADNYCGYGIFNEMHTFTMWMKSICKGEIWFYDCSIEKKYISNEVRKDLNLYNGITVRESISQRELTGEGVLVPVYFIPDPAFVMKPEKREWRGAYGVQDEEPYVVVNLSNLIIENTWGGNRESILKNYRNLIFYIRDEMDYKVVLLPHVMGGADLSMLKELKQSFLEDSGVVLFSEENISAPELKYIIGGSQFVVTARTHASIAAYSERIPTLVVGYSIKSKGIAEDLFGEWEHFVLPVEKLKAPDNLKNAFIWIVENRDIIVKKLSDSMPEYKRKTGEFGTLLFGKTIRQNPEDCCGCMACGDACPKNCISFRYARDGFWYPVVDEKRCIHCGICDKVCPMYKAEQERELPETYSAYTKDDSILLNSSSGGIFSEIARSFLGTYAGRVYGAVLSDDFYVSHSSARSCEELRLFMGSKYQQSSVNGCYREIADLLRQGEHVLFSGTPCQVAALYSFLEMRNLEYQDFLYTVEVVCHGVPSRAVLIKYLQELEEKSGKRPVSMKWRSKSHGWGPNRIKILFEDGTTSETTSQENPYQKGFLKNVYLRPSCYQCHFAKLPRVADITLADFWGYDGKMLESNQNKGISLLAVSSDKGKELLSSIMDRIEYHRVELDYVKKRNRHFWIHPEYNDAYHYVFANLDSLTFEVIDRQFINPPVNNTFVKRAIRKARRLIRWKI